MFSEDGGNKDPWEVKSEKSDKYMLEITYDPDGKATKIIVSIQFLNEEADGSLVFMAQ